MHPYAAPVNTIIETPRLTLRRFRADDWRDLHAYLSDEAVVRFEPYAPFSEADCRQEAQRRAQSSAFWAVCLRPNGPLIGNLYFGEADFDAWELGYVFNTAFQHCGYATESVRGLLDQAFTRWGVRRVVAFCNPHNTASWRLMERIGMRREGHLKQNIYFRTDAHNHPLWQDTYAYALLASEWPQVE